MTLTKFPELDSFAHLLKENGFTVILIKQTSSYQYPTWLHFFKNGQMGYVQRNTYNFGWDFSTSYKPSKGNGSGCKGIDMTELTLENAEKVLTGIYERGIVQGKVFRYTSPEEFINHSSYHRENYYIL